MAPMVRCVDVRSDSLCVTSHSLHILREVGESCGAYADRLDASSNLLMISRCLGCAHSPRTALGHGARRALIVLGSLIIINVLALAWESYRHSPTIDEISYLPAGLSHWRLGNFHLANVNPPLV